MNSKKGTRGRKSGQENNNLTTSYDIGINFDRIPTAKEYVDAFREEIIDGIVNIVPRKDTPIRLFISRRKDPTKYSANEQRYAKLNGLSMTVAQLIYYGYTGKLLPAYAFIFKNGNTRDERYDNLEVFEQGKTKVCKTCEQPRSMYEFKIIKFPTTAKPGKVCNLCKLEKIHLLAPVMSVITLAAEGKKPEGAWITDIEDMTEKEQYDVEQHIDDLLEQDMQPSDEADLVAKPESAKVEPNYFHTVVPPAYVTYYKEDVQPRELALWYSQGKEHMMQPTVAEIEAIARDRLAGASLKDIATVLNRPLQEIDHLSKLTIKMVIRKMKKELEFT